MNYINPSIEQTTLKQLILKSTSTKKPLIIIFIIIITTINTELTKLTLKINTFLTLISNSLLLFTYYLQKPLKHHQKMILKKSFNNCMQNKHESL